jgi:nicotinate-nucleotide adenylyltransferase
VEAFRVRYGILGGSFDPPHVGHLVLAQEAVCRLRLERLYLVPAADPPHKNAPAAPAADRIEMLRLAIEGEPRMSVSDIELRRAGKSYSIDTVRALRAAHDDAPPFLIVGADSIPVLPHWKDVHTLLDLCTLVIATRPGTPDAALRELTPHLGAARVEALERQRLRIPALDISSSLVRERAGKGWPIRYLVPRGVARHIAARGLYGASPPTASPSAP